jgi:hypothetical protein
MDIDEMTDRLNPDFHLRGMIAEARLKLRKSADKLTQGEIAAEDRKKRAKDFETRVGMKLAPMVSVMGLDLKVVFIEDSPAARFRIFGNVFYLRSTNGAWHLSQLLDDGVETDVAEVQDDDPLFKGQVLVAIDDHRKRSPNAIG